MSGRCEEESDVVKLVNDGRQILSELSLSAIMPEMFCNCTFKWL